VSPPRPITGVAAARILARLTWTRARRSKGLWLSVALSALPILFVAAVASRWDPDQRWTRTMTVLLIPLLALLPPLNLAPIVAEEAEDQTASYLWSRPMPRWALLAGKGATLIPLVAGALMAVAGLVWAISYSGDAAKLHHLARGAAALGLGTLAAGALAIAVGVLIRRQAVAVSAGYLLVIDLPLGAVPLSSANLSITYHARALAAVSGDGAVIAPIVWLIALTGVWLAVAFWRVSRLELAGSS
jgi:ABC-type transport system involved in multi-copper enzyme maturation permease subunit